eukprot:2278457-Pleurochrysis_carterae.AAC.1
MKRAHQLDRGRTVRMASTVSGKVWAGRPTTTLSSVWARLSGLRAYAAVIGLSAGCARSRSRVPEARVCPCARVVARLCARSALVCARLFARVSARAI